MQQAGCSVWDAVRADDVQLLRAFFVLEGAEKLLCARCREPDEGGRTLLHMAAWHGSIHCAHFLLALGADACAIDNTVTRATPLHEAARAGQAEICARLLEAGADVRAADGGGFTGVHWAALRGRVAVLGTLLDTAERLTPGSTRGLLNVQTHKGKTPAELAASPATLPLLQRWAAADKMREKQRREVLARVRRGLARARLIGGSVAANTLRAVQGQYARYGRVRVSVQAGSPASERTSQDTTRSADSGGQ